MNGLHIIGYVLPVMLLPHETNSEPALSPDSMIISTYMGKEGELVIYNVILDQYIYIGGKWFSTGATKYTMDEHLQISLLFQVSLGE